MAQSDRNLVFHSGTKAYPPRQLRQQANVEDQDRAVHHLFQRHHGQALPLDLRRKASRVAHEPKMSPSIPLGCTSRRSRAARFLALALRKSTKSSTSARCSGGSASSFSIRALTA